MFRTSIKLSRVDLGIASSCASSRFLKNARAMELLALATRVRSEWEVAGERV